MVRQQAFPTCLGYPGNGSYTLWLVAIDGRTVTTWAPFWKVNRLNQKCSEQLHKEGAALWNKTLGAAPSSRQPHAAAYAPLSCEQKIASYANSGSFRVFFNLFLIDKHWHNFFQLAWWMALNTTIPMSLSYSCCEEEEVWIITDSKHTVVAAGNRVISAVASTCHSSALLGVVTDFLKKKTSYSYLRPFIILVTIIL